LRIFGSDRILTDDNKGRFRGSIIKIEWDKQTGHWNITVRNSDAHAWVKVNFEDVGWVPFDPTPSLEHRDRREEVPEWILPRWEW
jgi:transglutaminase-like putative cysteine protease